MYVDPGKVSCCCGLNCLDVGVSTCEVWRNKYSNLEYVNVFWKLCEHGVNAVLEYGVKLFCEHGFIIVSERVLKLI